jgi:septum formation protein
MKVILASQSPTRYKILKDFGISPEVIKTGADENISGSPDYIVKELAGRKAAKALEIIGESPGLLIAADTVVAFGDKILGKPEDERDAFKMLSMLSGKNHEVYSGLALVFNGRMLCDFDVTRVKFKELSEREINLYIKTGDPMTRAGSYGAEGLGAAFVEKIDGDFMNVAGLPVYKFVKMLETGFGLSIFDLI